MESVSGYGVLTRRKVASTAAARTVCNTVVARRPQTTLMHFIARRPVNCSPLSLDPYGRTVATCSVGGTDLGEWLVRKGLALDWPQYSKGRYGEAQRDAERAGQGIWKASYVEPWLYRACIRANGKPPACSDDANAHPSGGLSLQIRTGVSPSGPGCRLR